MTSSDFDTRVRSLIYDTAISTARIPTREEIATQLERGTSEVAASLERLHDAHVVVLQPENREILMANPFCAIPTPFVVRSGRLQWNAICIWDSMGIAAMTGERVELETSCGCCGMSLRLRIPEDCVASDDRVAHFAVPAAQWWNDIIYN